VVGGLPHIRGSLGYPTTKAAEQGGTQEDLKAQLENFIKVFPEFKDHELLNDLNDIIKQEI